MFGTLTWGLYGGMALIVLAIAAIMLFQKHTRREEETEFETDMLATRQAIVDQATEKLIVQLKRLLRQIEGGTFCAVNAHEALQHAIARLGQAKFELNHSLDRAGALIHDAEGFIRLAGFVPKPGEGESARTQHLTASQILGNGPHLWWLGALLTAHGLAGPIAPPRLSITMG